MEAEKALKTRKVNKEKFNAAKLSIVNINTDQISLGKHFASLKKVKPC